MNYIVTRFWDPILNYLPKLPFVVLGLVIGYIIIRIVLSVLKNTLKYTKVPKALSGIIISMLTIIFWVLLFGEMARALGFTSIAITISGSLLVLGLALANGATTLTSDIISGVFLAKDEDFEVGFRVKTGDVEGVIQKVDIRKVRIVADDGKLHIVPNVNLDKNGWVVLERELKDDELKLKNFIRKSS
ncbi:MAG: mechanosensitive ion channel domain-containing protein [Patescibacteria group bacterium]